MLSFQCRKMAKVNKQHVSTEINNIYSFHIILISIRVVSEAFIEGVFKATGMRFYFF